MVKVLIYSSKSIYDSAGFEGRSEADIVAYRVDERNYRVLKNKNGSVFLLWTEQKDLVRDGLVSTFSLKRHIDRLEKSE